MTDDGRVYAGGEVFQDIWHSLHPDDPERAATKRARAQFMLAISREVASWDVTQVEAARRLGIKQPRLNLLLKGRMDRFSLDTLMELAIRAGIEVKVEIGSGRRRAAAAAKPSPRRSKRA